MKRIKYVALLNLLVLLNTTSAVLYAGAWTQKKGEGLNIATGQYYQSTNYWTTGGHLRSSPIYKKAYGSDYFEYGITDRLTLGGYFSGLVSYTQAGGTQGGGNDNLVLGRFLLWKNDNYILSAQAFFDALGHGARLNIPAQNSSYNSGQSLLIGTSGSSKNKKMNWFCDASVGLIQRYGPGNQVQVILEAGWKFNSDRFWIFVQEYNTISTTYTINQAYNLFTIAPSILLWPSKHIGLQFGLTQDFYGQNVGEGIGPFASIWFALDKERI